VVNVATGKREQQIRNQKYLTKKMVSLIIDIVAVFWSGFVTPASFLFGTTSNSRQFAIHTFIINIPVVITVSMTAANLRGKLNKSGRINGKPLVTNATRMRHHSARTGCAKPKLQSSQYTSAMMTSDV
jgi:hypothetical protein